MAEPFGFECVTCGTYHVGIPSFGWDYPVQYLLIPEHERERRIELSSDACVIDRKWFFVRGCLEIPVLDHEESSITRGCCLTSACSLRTPQV